MTPLRIVGLVLVLISVVVHKDPTGTEVEVVTMFCVGNFAICMDLAVDRIVTAILKSKKDEGAK